MAAGGPHISISAEKLFSVGPLNVNNSMLTSVVVSGLLILFALWVRASLKKTNRPTGVQNLAEWIVESLYSLVQNVTGDKQRTESFFPFIATFFLFILLNNWLGLLPGVGSFGCKLENGKCRHFQLASVITPNPVPAVYAATPEHTTTPAAAKPAEVKAAEAATLKPTEATHQTEAVQAESGHKEAATAEHAEASEHEEFVPYFRAGTADLNMTLALGIISMAAVQFFGLKYLHLSYLKKFFNFSNPINAFVGILELVSEFSKIMSFAFRLFGNVFAGEVLLAVIGFLIPVIAPMPFYGMEIFVGFVQALVFSMLSVVLFNMATASHGDEH